MKRIIKSDVEPEPLRRYREDSNGINYTWSNFRYPYKDDYRNYLLKEQGEICAYCMKGISSFDTKIEHLQPRHSCSEQKKLQDSNMVCVCKGLTDTEMHCDTFRGNLTPPAKQIMNLSPLINNPNCEEIIEIQNGEVISSNTTYDDEINNKLNLNCNALIEIRKKAEQGYIEGLVDKFSTWSIDILENELNKLLQTGIDFENRIYEEFCIVKINVLKSKIENIQSVKIL